MVMMASIVPAFALNDTSNNTTDQSTQTTTQNQHQYGQKTTAGDGGNHGTCDGDQHKYKYGQENSTTGSENSNHTKNHQYGQENSKVGTGNCDGQNCKNTT